MIATPANEYVVDTVGLIFRLMRRHALGQTAKTIFDGVEAGRMTVYVSGLSFAEVLIAVEKQRITFSLQDLEEYLQRYPNYKQYPIDLAVVQTAAQINDIPELHDRLIAATARLLNLPLITNDVKMQASSFVQTVW